MKTKKTGVKAPAIPNPDLEEKYPGMLKKSERLHKNAGQKRNLGTKRDDLIPIMKARKGTKYNNNIPEVDGIKPVSHCQATGKLSAYQRRTHKNFMKVRKGETHEKWLHRTRFRRMLSPNNALISIYYKPYKLDLSYQYDVSHFQLNALRT